MLVSGFGYFVVGCPLLAPVASAWGTFFLSPERGGRSYFLTRIECPFPILHVGPLFIRIVSPCSFHQLSWRFFSASPYNTWFAPSALAFSARRGSLSTPRIVTLGSLTASQTFASPLPLSIVRSTLFPKIFSIRFCGRSSTFPHCR